MCGGCASFPAVTESIQPQAPPEPTEDVGPDPVWGLGLFIVGLLIMATGGAMTWHYTFNVGEGILLLGVVVFLASVARTALLQQPVDWSKMPWTEGDDEAEEGEQPSNDGPSDGEGGEDDDA